MSVYVVLVDTDLKRCRDEEPAAPKVVAHNLTRAAAEGLEAQLRSDSVEGEGVGWAPYVWECAEPHADTEPEHCLQCQELVLEHMRYLLGLLEQERKRRGVTG